VGGGDKNIPKHYLFLGLTKTTGIGTNPNGEIVYFKNDKMPLKE